MATAMATWEQFEKVQRDQAYGTMFADPESLLMHDGGPLSIDADLFHARMLGFDEQIDHEWWLPRLTDVLRVPIRQRVAFAEIDDISPTTPEARYILQSGWVVMTATTMACFPPKGVRARADGTFLTAYLLYRRRT